MNKWKKVKIKDVCTKGTSSLSLKDLDGKDGDFPVYGAAGLAKKVNFYQQENKYLAIIKDGSGVGRLYRFDGKTSVLGTMQYIFPSDSIDCSFCYYALQSIDFKKYVNGAAIPHIYFKDYSQEEIPLPAMEEQKEIAARLDAVSDLLAKQKQLLAEQDTLIQSLFYDMFGEHQLSQQKEQWNKISDVAVVAGGSTPKTQTSEYWDGDLNWFTPAELENCSWYVYSSQRKITKAGVKSCHLEEFPINTVLLSSRAPIGKLAI
ncbi:MAG: restriction endonuclease subunit S, partial [Alphaproteobacteria bacterium]